MSEFDSTNIQIDNDEVLYCQELQGHIDFISPKIPRKKVIKQGVYDDIIKCVFMLKGKVSGSYSLKFIFCINQHFV